jgi:hypothetical protein
MSFIKSKNKIISIIENIAPSNNFEFGNVFKYVDFNIDSIEDVQSRCFSYSVSEIAIDALNCTRKRFFVSIEINMHYKEEINIDNMYDSMLTDYEIISCALIRQSNWDYSSSGIVIIDDESDFVINANVITDDEYGGTLTFSLKITYDKK